MDRKIAKEIVLEFLRELDKVPLWLRNRTLERSYASTILGRMPQDGDFVSFYDFRTKKEVGVLFYVDRDQKDYNKIILSFMPDERWTIEPREMLEELIQKPERLTLRNKILDGLREVRFNKGEIALKDSSYYYRGGKYERKKGARTTKQNSSEAEEENCSVQTLIAIYRREREETNSDEEVIEEAGRIKKGLRIRGVSL